VAMKTSVSVVLIVCATVLAVTPWVHSAYRDYLVAGLLWRDGAQAVTLASEASPSLWWCMVISVAMIAVGVSGSWQRSGPSSRQG